MEAEPLNRNNGCFLAFLILCNVIEWKNRLISLKEQVLYS